MEDKQTNNNKMVFEMNKEEGEYIEHVKQFLFNDYDVKPNQNNFKKPEIGKFRKDKDIKTEAEKLNNLTEEKKKKNLHEGHRKRLRETFNNVDPLTMPDHQILELMLSYVQPQKDVNPLAHELLNEFGSLSDVLDASVDDLKKIKGVGEVLASYLHFCSKIPAIYNNSKTSYKTKLKNISEIVDYLRSKVPYGQQEEFFYLCLNNKSNVLCFKSLGKGNINNIYIDIKVLLQQILKYPTKDIVICHTHPSGTPYPSSDDRRFTLELLSVLEKIKIRLIDHVIISPDGYFSFFQNGTEALGQDSDLKARILFSGPIFDLKPKF